ncbi:FIP1[V]-like protein isoform X1 [Dendrobium catenatum]|uniref:FIP1[V]-like protein isoform X1 n=1 Tax=Dendrobium catenatum TaxID=906689 RepID=UPI0010A02CDC|nr:FIP1[V]-like protein isoform X1 [Dendrobium catenatum]
MEDLDDFGELYADLEDRLIVGVPTAEAEDEEMEERGAGYENGAMESLSSSDSEDDLQIVLNEEDYANKFPAQLLAERRGCEEDEGGDLVIVTGSDCTRKEPNWAEQVHSAEGLLRGHGDRGNATNRSRRNRATPCLAGSAVRARKSLPGRSHCNHLTVPCSLGNTFCASGFPLAFSNGYDFYLPRNGSIFNIDVESLECKPWRFNGADITDYFNFGLDEEGWRTYCSQLQVHFQQKKLPLHESSKVNKPTGIMSGEVAQHGRDSGLEIPDYGENGRKGIKVPKGRAIQVESGNGDRIPSVDVRRPRIRDSDVVIQITTGIAVEDALVPIKNGTYLDDHGSKSELLLNSKNEFCKSSSSVVTCARKCEGSSNSSECPLPCLKKFFDEKLDNMTCGRDCPSSGISLSKSDANIAGHSCGPKSSDHNVSFEASRDEISLEKIPIPECVHLNSDSLLQESVLSHCYSSSESGSGSKTDGASSGGHSPESLLDLDYCQETTIFRVVESKCSSDDEVASPLVHRPKIDGEHQAKETGTIVSHWDDEPGVRDHSSQRGKISLKNIIEYNNEKEVNATAFSACSQYHDADPLPVRIREKRTAAREVNTRKNGCCNNQRMAQRNSRAQSILNRDYLQSGSRKISLYDKTGCHKSRIVDAHHMITRAHYNSMEAKDRHREGSFDDRRERSLDKYFGWCVPYLEEEDESFINKYDRDSHSAGALRRLQEYDRDDKTMLVHLERSSRYAYNHQDSSIYEDGSHPKIYREAYDEEKSGWHEDDSHRNQVPSLFKPDRRYKCHSGHSHTRETFSQLRSKHGIVSSKKCHLYSRTGFNLDVDPFPAEVRKSCPDNSTYNESRKSSLALPGLLVKKEASIRHQDSNLYSPKRHTFDGTSQFLIGRVDERSFSELKIYDNHRYNRGGSKLTVRSCKDSDSLGRVGSPSDNFVKHRRQFDNRGCRQAVSEHLKGWEVKVI